MFMNKHTKIPSDVPSLLTQVEVHANRQALYEELHSRPSPLISGACEVVQFTLLADDALPTHQHLVALCHAFQQREPSLQSSCFYQLFEKFELRFERHSEFVNYSFIFPTETPFSSNGLLMLPKEWLASLPGELVAATRVVLVEEEPSHEMMKEFFAGERLSGAHVAELSAKVWTSFKLHDDGFGRVLIFNRKLSAYQSGRLLQRVLELETYRLLSLLALPVARNVAADLAEVEGNLAELNSRVSDIQNKVDERQLLQAVSLIAADIEHRLASTHFRFAAAVAYHDLVNDRLRQLKEQPLEGMQSLQEFLQRRLTPGIKTIHAVKTRLEDTSQRIVQTTNLIQARVDLAIQEQNQNLLASMNSRSELQLRLQQTVEGLSVVAISYYLVGLLGYVFEGFKHLGVPLNTGMSKGIAAPIVVVSVFLAVRRIRAHINKPDA